jgi:hypothetical protein
LNRLKDDVSPIITCIEEHNKNNELKIGFFPMVRIIMPIIEVVATSEGRKPQELMKASPYLGQALCRFSSSDYHLYTHLTQQHPPSAALTPPCCPVMP